MKRSRRKNEKGYRATASVTAIARASTQHLLPIFNNKRGEKGNLKRWPVNY